MRTPTRHALERRRLGVRQRIAVLGAVASIALGAIPFIPGTVHAASLDYMPEATTNLQLDPMEATIAPGGSHVFTVGAYDDGGMFLGDVSMVNGVSVWTNGEASCQPDYSLQAWVCSSDSVGDWTIYASYNGGGGETAAHGTAPQPVATPGYVADGQATLHVVEGGGSGTTTTCTGSSCSTDPISGPPGGPTTVTNVNSVVFGSPTDATVSADFVPGLSVVSHCGSSRPIGDALDVRIYGSNLASADITMTTLIIIPKATLKATHSDKKPAGDFKVCLGASYLPGDGTDTTGWRAQGTNKKHVVQAVGPEWDGTFQRYWGIAANCGTKGLTATDPCVLVRTKNARDLYKKAPWAQALGLMQNGDLAILIRTTSPWDGKGGVYQ